MLRQNVEAAGTKVIGIPLPRLHRVQGRARLKIFKTVARNDDGFAWLVQPVIGSADALEQAGRSLGRAHLDHAIDIAPIDAQVEARRRDERAQPAIGHRIFHLAPGLHRQAAMMDADRQVRLIRGPKLLEDEFRKSTRVAEDQSRLPPLDFGHDLLCGIFAGMPRPRDAPFRNQNRDIGISTLLPHDRRHAVDVAIGREPCAIRIDIRHRRGQRDTAQLGIDPLQPRKRQAEQIAAFLGGEGVDLIDDHRLQLREHQETVGVAEQQRERFGRGQQYLRRPRPLPRLAIRRGVARARLDPDRKLHLLDRGEQIAPHIDRQRLQRRHIEGMKTLGRFFDQVGKRRQEPRQCLPRPRGRNEQGMIPCPCGCQHIDLMAARRPSARGEPLLQGFGKALVHIDECRNARRPCHDPGAMS